MNTNTSSGGAKRRRRPKPLGLGRRRATGIAAAATLGVLLSGCTRDAGGAGAPGDDTVSVVIKGQTFHLAPALDDATRIRGLGGVEEIPRNGGMLFVFPRAQHRAFVMRDCVVPIDIAYLDDAGRVLTVYEMEVEEPQRPDESDWDYEYRLKQYPSRYPCRFVVEVQGGRFAELGVQPGDLFRLDLEGLKRRAR